MYLLEIWLRYGNQMCVSAEKLCWEARLLCGWESVRDIGWLKRVSLIRRIIVENSGIEIVVFESEWLTDGISDDVWRRIPSGYMRVGDNWNRAIGWRSLEEFWQIHFYYEKAIN